MIPQVNIMYIYLSQIYGSICNYLQETLCNSDDSEVLLVISARETLLHKVFLGTLLTRKTRSIKRLSLVGYVQNHSRPSTGQAAPLGVKEGLAIKDILSSRSLSC